MKKKLSRIAKYLALLLILVVAIAIAIGVYLFFVVRNPESGTLQLKGLQGPVTVTRDQYGVPHIKAMKSDEDAMFALGFVHGQDRMWEMEFHRRVVSGTLSEVLGVGALDKDKYLRTWGFYRSAKDVLQHLDKKTLAVIKSYTAGVNAFLETGHLPLQFKLLRYRPKPWTDIDSIAWQKMMAWDLNSTWKEKIKNYLIVHTRGEDELAVLEPPYPADKATVLSNEDLKIANLLEKNVPDVSQQKKKSRTATELRQALKKATQIRKELGFQDAPGKGSNNWVLSGKLTKSGKPLLGCDPHLGFRAPSLWYLAEITGPTLHVIGATIPGLPVVIIGRNDHIAWGVTNVNPDVQDLYIESPQTKLISREEVIKVKGAPDVHYTVEESIHGPIIGDVTEAGKLLDNKVAIKWTALLPNDTTVQAYHDLNYATNWKEFTDALSKYVAPTQNFVYADVKGNIGYYAPGRVPIRNNWSGRFPVEPWQSQEWDGYIPFEKLPHVYNPPEGFIATANNKITPTGYPYTITFRWQYPHYRIERILSLLKQNKQFTVEDMEAIQQDNFSTLWQDLKPLLLKTKPLNRASRNALKRLKKWDGMMTLDSIPSTIFTYWFRQLGKMTPEEVLAMSGWPEPLFIKQQLETDGDYCKLNQHKDCADFMSHSLKNAMMAIKNELGNSASDWKWSRVHHAVFDEVGLGSVKSIAWIWNREISAPGGDYTVNVGTYRANDFNQIYGATYRHIIDMSDFNNSRYIHTLGQSGNPLHRHYSDLLEKWRDGKYLRMSVAQRDWGKTSVLNLVPR